MYKMWINRYCDLIYNAETLNVLFSFTAKLGGFLIVRATPFESSSECNSLLLKIKQTWFLPEAAAATASACILVRGREGERAAEVVAAEPEPELLFELLTRVREGTDLTLTWPLSFSTGTLPQDAACFLAFIWFSLSPWVIVFGLQFKKREKIVKTIHK